MSLQTFKSCTKTLIAAVCWCMLAAGSFAQQDAASAVSQTGQDQPPAAVADKTPDVVLPARTIIALFRTRPELIVDVKRFAADSMQAQGINVQEDSITDEMLYQRIAVDTEFRRALTSWLWTRGYITQTDIEQSLASPGAADDDQEIPATPSTDLLSAQLAGANAIQGKASASALGNGQLDRASTLPARQKRKTPSSTPQVEQQRDPNQPAQDGLVHQPTPLNLLALRDLYTQVPEQTSSLRRFGSDAFLHRGMDSSEIATDLPVGPDYVLGPGDSLVLSLWGSLSQNSVRIVNHEGYIVLPEAGPVLVSGLTLAQAQELAESKLRPQFRDIHVQLTLSRVRTVRIYVVGDVQRPGAYDVSSLSTALNALYAAGGPTAVGSLRTIRHYRNKQLVREIDLYDFLLHGLRNDPELLEPGDTILVPPAGKQVTIAGMVRRPAIYELREERNLDDAIGLAGGLLVSASTTQIKVDRVHPHAGRVTETIPVLDPANMDAVRKSLQDYAVEDGDRVMVAPILPYSEKAVYVEGHVVRPGKFAYHDDMLLTDILHSYADLLPEPADRAEIVRLRPPDFRPETIEVSLSEALIGNSRIHLQPFDTVRVVGRYELDAPKVTIQGEVLRPGSYPLSENLTAAQLVRLAGGFKRDALLDHADLTSYDIKQGANVSGHRTTIDIGRAVAANDPAADIPLKPGDVLTVYQISGWNDIGASIVLNGEVTYPGTYGIQDGERLSSVLKRAGGFRDTAYPAGAVLTRVQVRDFQDKSRAELIRQIETTSAATKISPTLNTSDQAATLQILMQQQQLVLQRLRSQASSGRMVIKIGADLASWEGTPADIELRSGDMLVVPKRPGFVLVTGQVYNSAAIAFSPGKSANWYLRRAGGPTDMANKKDVFIIRANGSVVGRDSSTWFGEDVMHIKLDPGDVVVVPQKFIGGSVFWRNLLATAQFMASFAITAKVAGF